MDTNITPKSYGKNPLKLGVIGGSVRSAVGYAHFAAYRMDGLFEVVAGCFSRNNSINQESAKTYGVSEARTYSDWRELLDAEAADLDAVLVLTPTPDHAEIVVKALEIELPVICEKAMTSSVEEAVAIHSLKQQKHGFVAVTYNYSGYPIIRELRNLIEQGSLGNIQQIQIEMPQEGFARKDESSNPIVPQEWRLKDGEIETLHLDLGVHVHQLIHYLTKANPVSAIAVLDRLGSFEGVTDNLNAMARYDNGMLANIWYSKAALGHRNGLRIRVYGDKASAEWFQADPESLSMHYVDGRKEIKDRGAGLSVANAPRYTRFKVGHPAGYIEAFANLYVDIHDAIWAHKRGAKKVSKEVFGTEFAIEGLCFLKTLSESARMDAWLDIPKMDLAEKE